LIKTFVIPSYSFLSVFYTPHHTTPHHTTPHHTTPPQNNTREHKTFKNFDLDFSTARYKTVRHLAISNKTPMYDYGCG
jgi:hypothetical protein